MAPKDKQKIAIEKTHRDPLLSFNQPVTAGSDFLGTALEKICRSWTIRPAPSLHVMPEIASE